MGLLILSFKSFKSLKNLQTSRKWSTIITFEKMSLRFSHLKIIQGFYTAPAMVKM